jgi:peptidoglycan-associated lipoprotein
MRRLAILAAIALAAAPAAAQLRLPGTGQRQPPPPALSPIDALRAEFRAAAGSDIIYFALDSARLGPQARAALQAQALWILRHPEVTVRIEGHGDGGDTRSHALALGARRAEAIRAYFVLLGVPAAQVSAASWGKERPGPPRAITVISI